MTEKSILDPVCGHKVNLEVALVSSYDENKFFFCSKKCQNTFKKNPTKYASIQENASYLKKKVTSNLENISFKIKEVIFKLNDCMLDTDEVLKEINDLKGIESVFLNNKQEICIKYNEDYISKHDLITKINEKYPKLLLIKEKDIILSIKNLIYPSKCFYLEKKLLSIHGINKVKVDFLSDEIWINYISEEIKIDQIISLIESLGFDIILHENDTIKKLNEKNINYLKSHLILAFTLTFGIFIINILNIEKYYWYNLIIIIFSTIVNLGSGLFLLKKSLNNFKTIYISEGLILFFAGLITYFYSITEFFIPDFTISSKTFFDLSSSIISLSLFSLYLMQVLKDGVQKKISAALKGFLISKNLEQVKNSKLPTIIKQMYISEYKIEKISNIILRYFPVYIILFSLLSFVITFIFRRDIGFYSSLLNGLNIIILSIINLPYLTINLLKIHNFFKISESKNFIFRNNESFENLGKMRNIILEKKGVITKNKPFITDIVTFDQIDGNTILKYVASVENYVNNSISEAVIKEAKQKNIDLWIPDSVNYFPSLGIEAKLKNYDILIGSKNFLKLKNIDTSIVSKISRNVSSEGKSEVFISLSNKLSAVIAVFDNIKTNSFQIIHILKSHSINIFILSSDSNLTSQFWSEKLNIPKENIFTELTPAKKVKRLEILQKELGVVGILTNKFDEDSYMKKADVVLSFSNELCSKDINGISILNNDLNYLSTLIDISKKTVSKIFRNFLFLAIFIIFVIFSSVFQGFYGLYLEPLSLGVLIIILFLIQIVSFIRKN